MNGHSKLKLCSCEIQTQICSFHHACFVLGLREILRYLSDSQVVATLDRKASSIFGAHPCLFPLPCTMLQWPMAMCGFHPDFICLVTKQEESLALGEEISDLKRTGATSTKAKAKAKTELAAHVVSPVAPGGSKAHEPFAWRKEAWR